MLFYNLYRMIDYDIDKTSGHNWFNKFKLEFGKIKDFNDHI